MNSNIYCLILLLTLMACHKDSDEVIHDEDYPDPPVVIVSTRLVSIADTTFPGFEDAIQTFSNQVAHFDQLPFLQIKGESINRDYELVRLTTKEGLDLYQVQTFLENDINYLHWTHPAITHFSGDANQSSDYPFTSGNTLHIPAQALTDNSGQLYQGAYDLFVALIDPADSSAFAIPSFTGTRDDGQKVSMVMKACYYVQALTPDGQPLTFQSGHIVYDGVSSGDAWYFDPHLALWILHREEEEMVSNEIPLTNSGYYSIAEHSSLIRVAGQLKINASPSPHYPIYFLYDGQVRRIFTTNSGKWALHVPSDSEITARIKLPCNQSEEINISTTLGNDQVVPFNVTAGEIINAHITGTARDCFGQPLSDHLILITTGKDEFLFQDRADLSFNVLSCAGQVIGLKTLDPVNNEYGPEIFWPVAPTIDISSSFGCGMAQEEYLLLNIDGQRKMYWNLQSAVTPQDRLLIENGLNETELDFHLYITGMEEGAYEDTQLNIVFEDQTFGNKGYSLYCPTSNIGCGFTEFRITHFPDQAGEWIRGHFKGNFWIKTLQPLTAGYRQVEGEFQVYRDF